MVCDHVIKCLCSNQWISPANADGIGNGVDLLRNLKSSATRQEFLNWLEELAEQSEEQLLSRLKIVLEKKKLCESDRLSLIEHRLPRYLGNTQMINDCNNNKNGNNASIVIVILKIHILALKVLY